MSEGDAQLLDTRDMVAVHEALNDGLTTAINITPDIPDGDSARAVRLGGFVSEVLWLLHAHHRSEDALMYPLLIERAPDDVALFSEMDDQHVVIGRPTRRNRTMHRHCGAGEREVCRVSFVIGRCCARRGVDRTS
jgi:hypothetical protein